MCPFEIDRAGNDGQRAEQLIRAAEQGPDVLVAELCKKIGQRQCDEGRKVFVGQDLAPGFHLVVLDRGIQEQFLERQTADTGHRVKRSQCKRRDREIDQRKDHTVRQPDLCQEVGDPSGEDLHRGEIAGFFRRTGHEAGDSDQRDDGKKGFQQHGAEGDRKHVLLTLDLLGRRAGGNQ